NGEGRSINLSADIKVDYLPDAAFLNDLNGDQLHVAELEGFPCVVASLSVAFQEGMIVHFVDPVTLRPIRQPRYIGDDWAEFRLAMGRWLVATRIGEISSRPLLAIWDLTDPKPDPIGEWCVEVADIYAPRVVHAGSDTFHVYFTLRLLLGEQERY